MREKRISPRYQTVGHARIPGVLKNDLFIKNISITGCCLECLGNVSLPKPDEKCKVEIKPELVARIGKFEFEAECKWVRHTESTSEMGLTVTVSPQGKFFQNYVDYIAYYKSQIK
jgi:hypothetical protein